MCLHLDSLHTMASSFSSLLANDDEGTTILNSGASEKNITYG
jgi:hypothetical protein